MNLRVSPHRRLVIERLRDEYGEVVPRSLVIQFDCVLTRKEFERAWKAPHPYRVWDMQDMIKDLRK